MPILVLEGGEGSGKDTQASLLKERLDPEQTLFTREPGGTEVGEQIRKILLNSHMEPESELLMFLVSRLEHIRKVVRPALQAGKLVVMNRFALSTIAYQIYGRKQKHLLPLLDQFYSLVLGDLEPPYYIWFDVPPEIGIQRVKGRNDGMTVFDAEELKFHHLVRQGYLEHYNDNGRGVRIDTSPSKEVVAEQVMAQIRAWRL